MSKLILVNENQKENPVLKFVKRVPWNVGDIKADYAPGNACNVLFLSLRYHRLHPDYIYNRMSRLGRERKLRIIMVLADIDNPAETLKDLTKACFINDFALIVCWSQQEVAGYLEELKLNENTQGELIKGYKKTTYEDQLNDALTNIRRINKTDVRMLSSTYGSFRDILRNVSTAEELQKIEGLGPLKAADISNTFHEPLHTHSPQNQKPQNATDATEQHL